MSALTQPLKILDPAPCGVAEGYKLTEVPVASVLLIPREEAVEEGALEWGGGCSWVLGEVFQSKMVAEGERPVRNWALWAIVGGRGGYTCG